MALSLSARERPYVIIHKSNGGYLAWLNLYNDIQYTPSADASQPALLNCEGAGWSFCRVPRLSMGEIGTSSLPDQNWLAVNKACCNAINQIIEFSETHNRAGNNSGSKSVTVSVPNGSRSSNTTYYVKGEWQYNSYGEGDLYIYINVGNVTSRM